MAARFLLGPLMPRKPKNRIEAALLHLAISALVVGSVFLVVYFVWYPPPLFKASGGRHLFLTLALVDVVIGPLLTLLVFRPGKPSLRTDLAMIGVLQLGALLAGTYVVHQARPVWIVYAQDRFDVIRANQLAGNIAKAPPAFRDVPWSGPKLAAANQPKDLNTRMAIVKDALAGGADVTGYPELYREYAEVRPEVVSRARPLAELLKLDAGAGPRIAQAVASTGRAEADVRFLPAQAGTADLAMLIDAKTGDALKLIELPAPPP
jgi:hypothetical protein